MTIPAALVDSRLEKGVLVLTVTLREITDDVAGPLRGVLLDAVASYGAHRVVPDFSHVEYLSSAGTSVLLALKYLLLAVGSAALWYWMSAFVDRPRPSPELVRVAVELPRGGFPSGHVLNLTAMLGFLA